MEWKLRVFAERFNVATEYMIAICEDCKKQIESDAIIHNE